MSVDLATIERDLRDLWKDSAAEAPAGQAVTRALTMNLLARASTSPMADTISAVIQQLTASHPNRAVVVISQPEAPAPQLDAWVQANCLLAAPGVPQVCGEQVTIDARGVQAGPIASLVLPLLVPDLPVVLWLPGPAPYSDPLLARLRPVLDRLIVDSADFADPLHDLITLAESERGMPVGPGNGAAPPALSDLNWARLTPWRELTAQFFDTRSLLPHLHRLDRVEIDYATEEAGGLLRALLLAGWLAASLGWTLLDAGQQQNDAQHVRLSRPAVGAANGETREITVALRATSATGGPTGLAALRLRATDNILADFSVDGSADPTCVQTTAQVAGQPTVNRLAHVERAELADLLAAELRLLSRDHTFSAALQAAASFAQQLV